MKCPKGLPSCIPGYQRVRSTRVRVPNAKEGSRLRELPACSLHPGLGIRALGFEVLGLGFSVGFRAGSDCRIWGLYGGLYGSVAGP